MFPFFRLKEQQICFGRIDLVRANCYRAKRLDTKPLDHRSPNCWTSQYCFLSSNLCFQMRASIFFYKSTVINQPAVASWRLLGMGSKLYPSNMPCMLSKDLTRFMQSVSRVRKNRSGERKPLLTGCCYWWPTENVFKPDYSTKLESCTQFTFLLTKI